MKRSILKIIAAFITAAFVFLSAPQVKGVSTTTRHMVLIEASSKRILKGYRERERAPMASTTKIMTALLTLENASLDDTVEIPREATGIEGSSIYLVPGERLTVYELLLGLMLSSGNDAACALAIHVGGSIEGFVDMMNSRAEELYALDTHFTNPHGLHSNEHYTTAYDLALISAEALKWEVLTQICTTKSAYIPYNNSSEGGRYIANKNKLVLEDFNGILGLKIGYTTTAGRCLAAAAKRDNMTLIAVVLNCYDMFEECKTLLSGGFSDYTLKQVVRCGEEIASVNVKGAVQKSLKVITSKDVSVPLKIGEICTVSKSLYTPSLTAPVERGQEVGKAQVIIGGEVIAAVPIVALEGCRRNSFYERLKALAFTFFTGNKIYSQ
ncbi:MAG: D-alanyl-D-alanine carboxypeptidase [Clostridiales bacterium]|nr:D-alanyl-D-alanine carboxypeptidase [Clostridiales bacterium]